MDMHTLTKPTPVRLSPHQEQRLKTVGKKFGLKPAALIRLAIDSQLDAFERSGEITIRKVGGHR